MAKSTKGKDKKKPTKQEVKSVIEEIEEIAIIEEKIKEEDIRILKIIIESIENVEPIFTKTDVFVELNHSETYIGQTDSFVTIPKDIISIDFEIEIPVNIASEKNLLDILSCPLYIRVWQQPGEKNPELYPSMQVEEESITKIQTADSILSIYEAVLGQRLPDEMPEEDKDKVVQKVKIKDKKKPKEAKEKSKKDKSSSGKSSKESKKESKGSKDSKKSKDKDKNKDSATEDAQPDIKVCTGCTNLDLIPFFQGETEIKDKLPIYQQKIHQDNEIVPLANLPYISICVTLDKPLFGNDVDDKKLHNLFYLTVESMYNIPIDFDANWTYSIATVLPTENLKLIPVCYENGVFKEGPNFSKSYKVWPNLSHNENFGANTTTLLNEDSTNVKNKIGVDLRESVDSFAARISWNILQKCWLTEDAADFLHKHIVLYRRWPFEIELSRKHKEGAKVAKEEKKGKKGGSKSSKDSKSSGDSGKGNANLDGLHLMGFADISSLLYPGISKTRVACELRTYQAGEFTKNTGLFESYFFSKKSFKSSKEFDRTSKKKDKESSSKKSGKSDKNKKEKKSSITKTNESSLENSEPILNETGDSTFIIIEFELLKPFKLQKPLEDLTNELHTILPERPAPKPCVINMRFSKEFYRQTITNLAGEINKQYQQYMDERMDIDRDADHIEAINFIKYLQKNGIYQQYFTTLSRAVAMLIKERFNYNTDFKTTYAYDNYVSNVYVYLSNLTNNIIHEIMSCEMAGCRRNVKLVPLDYEYLTKEAVENRKLFIAEKYQLRAITEAPRNPDLWLNFAIFHLHMENYDKGLECVKEALAINIEHKYSLLVMGVILYEKNENYLAESTLLSLTKLYPYFLDGWVALYIFYLKKQQEEGCDLCMEMINKYSAIVEEPTQSDYIKFTEEIVWTTTLCNNQNIFYLTALTFIKLRLLTFADLALSVENFEQDGIYKYYQAVILYFAKDYEHALYHLDDAQKLHGPDYFVMSLIGHCYYHLNKYEDAKESYTFIVHSYEQPNDMHMLYMNLAHIYDKEENYEEARKYMLLVVQHSPTPYSWLFLGILFFKDEQLTRAEVCFKESNILDNNLAETWAYLVLLNIKLNRLWEAEQCYSQILRFGLKNETLLSTVQEAMKSV